jgi:hypothetical protein
MSDRDVDAQGFQDYRLEMVTDASARLVWSAAAVALTVTTAAGFGTALGARNTPDTLIVPTAELPPVMPFTFQITDVFELFTTTAVNCAVRFTRTVVLVGEIVMPTGGGAMTST